MADFVSLTLQCDTVRGPCITEAIPWSPYLHRAETESLWKFGAILAKLSWNFYLYAAAAVHFAGICIISWICQHIINYALFGFLVTVWIASNCKNLEETIFPFTDNQSYYYYQTVGFCCFGLKLESRFCRPHALALSFNVFLYLSIDSINGNITR